MLIESGIAVSTGKTANSVSSYGAGNSGVPLATPFSSRGILVCVPLQSGTQTNIPLDENGVANGTPEFPAPYDETEFAVLPVDTAMPDSISIQPSLTEEEIES